MSVPETLQGVGRGIELCFRIDGPEDGEPLLLLAGLGLDLTSWPRGLVDGLIARGFQVIRVDNRDAGRSTRVDGPAPNRWQQVTGTAPAGAYTLEDMATDAVGLLDALDVEQVHAVGMSLGGMIAQTVAAGHPARVRTLTSIFSTTGARSVGQPARSTILRMGRPPARTAEEFARRHVAMLRHIGSTAYPVDPIAEADWAIRTWERGAGNARGASVGRQIGAINASRDRTAALRSITAPTLVIHGDRDLMVASSGGRATAAAIPGSRHVTVPGMRHHLPATVAPRLIELIAEHAGAAGAHDARTRSTDR